MNLASRNGYQNMFGQTKMLTNRSSPVGLRQVAVATVVFIAWTLASFFCHECAKMFLQKSEKNLMVSSDNHPDKHLPFNRLLLAFILTTVQCSCCFLFVRRQSRQLTQSKGMLLLISSHALATFATNYSMAYIEASSTLAIKLTEPITMAAAHHILFRKHVPIHTAVSMPVIICGAFIFTGLNVNYFSDSTGASLAFASNIILAARNITLKQLTKDSSDTSYIALRPHYHILFTIFCQILFVGLMYFLEINNTVPRTSSLLIVLCLSSGIFHVAYSYISTNIVLKVMNVISHSIANIFKRFLVVLLLCALGTRHVSAVNLSGLAVAIGGLLFYTYGKTRSELHKEQNEDERLQKSSSGKFRLYLMFLATLSFITITLLLHKSTLRVTSKPRVNHLFFDIYRNTYRSDIQNPADDFSNIEINETDSEMREFLSWRLIDHPEETNRRAKTLTRNIDIVGEAERILVNLLQDLLGKAKHVMLIEIATYENKGDPAIAVGEVMLLRRMNITIVFYCASNKCSNNSTVNKAVEINKKYSQDELVILMQGGGNLVGYPEIDLIRAKYIEEFPERKIIIFSQSILLTSKKLASLEYCKKVYSNHSNIVMFLRDRKSLAIAKEHFKGVKLVLAPDMAFGIRMVPRQMPPMYDIMWLKRVDRESSNYFLPVFPRNITVKIEDWYHWRSNRGHTPMETSFLIASEGFQFLQIGRVIVTDRLHGHILATLMNIPHVLIDNPPHFKLSSFHRSWTQSLSNAILVTNGSHALDAAMLLLKRYHDYLPSIGPKDLNAAHKR